MLFLRFPDLPSLRPLKQSQAPLTIEEEIYFTHLVRTRLEQSKDRYTVVCKTSGQPIVLKKVTKPKEKSVLHLLLWGREGQTSWTKCAHTCRVPQLLTQWNSRAQNLNWQGNKQERRFSKQLGVGRYTFNQNWPYNSEHDFHLAGQNRGS